MDDSLEDWFRREILVHEGALIRFLARKWHQSSEVHDIRHDIYVRILESAEQERPIQPKAYLFSVARHILIERAPIISYSRPLQRRRSDRQRRCYCS